MADINSKQPGARFAFGSAARAAGRRINAAMVHADRHWAALALLPAVFWMANPNWLFNPLFTIDPWVYFGYFLNLPAYKASWFPSLYYGSRLTWVLPGYLIHVIFDVVTAHYILHVGMYLLGIFAFYWLLREAVGRRSALFTTILFGSQPAWLLAIGWDYVDGPGCTFTLLALACALRAGKSTRPRFWLLAVGLSTSAMVYTNLVLLLFFPGVLAFYVFPRHATINRQVLRTAFDGALWIGTAMCGVTLVLALVNHALEGTYSFYAPSLQYAANTVGKANIWSKAGLAWLPGAYWLVLPSIAVVTTIAFVAIRRNRKSLQWSDTRVLFSANYLACFGAMLVWELNKGYAFEHAFYASYLLPPLFLAVGCQIAGSLDGWRTSWFSVAAISVALLMAAPYRLIGQSIMRVENPDLRVLILIGVCVLLARIMWSNPVTSLLAVVLVFVWLQYLLIACGWFVWFLPPRGDNETILRRIAQGVRIVRADAAHERPQFWYNRDERFGSELWAINSSYLWGYTYISYDFPKIAADRVPVPESLVVILSALPREVVLDQAATALTPLHLNATVESRKDVGGRYFLTFVRIHDSLSKPLRAVIDETGEERLVAGAESQRGLPLDQWTLCTYPASPSSLAHTSKGVTITTASHHDAYGAKYVPLRASKDGSYRFALTYRLQKGNLVFGALAHDESRWIAHGMPLSSGGQLRKDTVGLHLQAGERIVLITSNGASGSSIYEILSLSATFTPDVPSLAVGAIK